MRYFRLLKNSKKQLFRQKIIINLLFIFIFQISALKAGNFIRYGGAYAAGLGQSVVANSDAGYFQNQALLTTFDSLYIELYSTMPFAVKEFGTHSFFAAYPALKGVFALQYHFFGYPNYNENKTGLAYSLYLTKGLSIGAQVSWFRIFVPQPYNTVNNVLAEFGICYKINRQISFGSHIYNPTLTKPVQDPNETPETAIRAGVAYTPVKNVSFNIEAVQFLSRTLSFRTGLDFGITDNLNVMAGYNHDEKTIGFGMGLKYKGLRLNAAFSYHNLLGYTPYLSFGKHF